jgi:hypothetical protein
MTTHIVAAGLVAIGLIGGMRSAEAQAVEQAASFEQLQMLVRPGDVITVIDDNGTKLRGTLTRLSSSSLQLVIGSTERTFEQSQVRTIRQRRGDSLANGAWTGLAVGMVIPAIALLALHDECYCTAAEVAGALGAYGGLGAGIGVGIDALVRRTKTIYSAPAAAGRVRLTPMLTHNASAMSVTIRF